LSWFLLRGAVYSSSSTRCEGIHIELQDLSSRNVRLEHGLADHVGPFVSELRCNHGTIHKVAVDMAGHKILFRILCAHPVGESISTNSNKSPSASRADPRTSVCSHDLVPPEKRGIVEPSMN
jgi:hypothetical protein